MAPAGPALSKQDKAAREAAVAEENEEDTAEPVNLPTALLHWHWANLEYANGTSLSSLSNRWWDADDEFDFAGGHYLLPDGYGGLLEKVAAGLDLKYGHCVTSVKRRAAGGVTVTAAKKASRTGSHRMDAPPAETNGGIEVSIDADAVVVTLPLGVLKAGAVQFSPPLPPRKQNAIDRLGFGVLNKASAHLISQRRALALAHPTRRPLDDRPT